MEDPDQGNIRRQQVVTIQSRQFLRLPLEVQERLFTPGEYSEMWPQGPDSIEGHRPRNIRIAHLEDQLLALANEKRDNASSSFVRLTLSCDRPCHKARAGNLRRQSFVNPRALLR